MSFARFAIRRCAVEAVRAGTYAKVYDSEMAPIEQFQDGQQIPSIIIYTDDATGDMGWEQVLDGGQLRLVFEVALTQKTKLPFVDPETSDVVEQELWVTPPTDSFMEMTLDTLCRDVMLAVSSNSPWAELLRDMCCLKGMRIIRGVAAEKEDRFAGRQIALDIEMPREPLRKVPEEGSYWARFLTLIEGTEDGAKILALLNESLSGDHEAQLTEQQLLMQSYGLTPFALETLKLKEVGEWGDT